MASSSLVLESVLGFSKDVTDMVCSLYDGVRECVLYAASNTLVLHDIAAQKQTFLQGHCNTITALAVSEDKRWAFSCDQGTGDTMLIV
ncbi:hypothetical protein KIPB_011709 [Kipferlia bialata]|uniref:Uncharacterized protein n=1 Tax=Kipferlia bialata TaxID=797122 RepID=A0A9K3GMG8_9EUKA|nr:hypothetical protein KIPB_011709 [Kipferlia bialata]|eukprot:g11709.t1